MPRFPKPQNLGINRAIRFFCIVQQRLVEREILSGCVERDVEQFHVGMSEEYLTQSRKAAKK